MRSAVRAPAIRAAATVFIASFCTLVIELVAGRVLAPHVGVSLYTWTSIIGVVLAGISAGAWAGGWIADRRPLPSTLGWLLLASGLTSIAIVPATEWLASLDVGATLLQRVIILSFLLFFLPSFFLGMISPVAVKLAVRDLDTTGRVVGRLYAFSTLGSIAGTFVTGFWLVAAFGTRTTLIGTGVVLIATSLILGFGARWIGAAVLIVAALAGIRRETLLPPNYDPLQYTRIGTLYTEESQYTTIRVERTLREDTGAPLLALHLDHLVHSYVDPADPAYLEYGYLRIFQDIARASRGRRFLFVGGGGYTLPRLLARDDPQARIDVAEIDPAVTRVAHRWFALPRNGRIRTINEDARWFAMRAGEGQYDAIFIDAFNDLSVPYHLTTAEATRAFARLLRPDGVLAANVIDDYGHGRFLGSYTRTLQTIFPRVAVVLEEPEDRLSERSTFVVLGSRSALPPVRGDVLRPDELRRTIARQRAIVLTDDYAPVDNMLAPLFAARFVDEQGN